MTEEEIKELRAKYFQINKEIDDLYNALSKLKQERKKLFETLTDILQRINN